MSLRESLARSKAKWKKRLHVGSKNPTPTPSSSNSLGTSTPSHIPATNAPTPPQPINTNSGSAVPTTSQSNHPSGVASTGWSGGKTLLSVLESGANAFGPLTSIIGRLSTCIDIHERAAKGRKDYEELRNKLKELVGDLRGCMVEQMGLEMTNSVKHVCTELEVEVKRVEEKLERTTVKQLVEAMDASEDIFECYRRIQTHLERLTLNTTMNVLKRLNDQNEAIERQTKVFNKQEMESRLKGMTPILSAIYNSAESDDIGRGGCTPGTRLAQIDLLLSWARDSKAGKTCWMNGMAGTGKTTIAYSVCSQLNESFGLGASFFCSRVISECRQVKNIIPSIAYQLARFSLPFRCALVDVLESDPDAHTRALKLQYDKLIVGPLLKVQDSLPLDLIVIIDALDECENENSLAQILDLILSAAPTLPIRFLVSSRPEPDIYRRMMSRGNEQGDTRLVLHELAVSDVSSDIATYMQREMRHIPLTDAQRSSLIQRCGVLFIYASTTCRYIDEGYKAENLENAIDTILRPASMPMEAGDENVIDELYSTILENAFHRSRRRLEDKRKMRAALETVICAQEPLTLHIVARILGLEGVKQVDALLKPLRSVLNIAVDNGLVTTLHASFPEFMFSLDRSGTFHCVASSRNSELAERCLEVIDAVEPKFNICGLSSSFLFDGEVKDLDERVREKIPSIVIYSCRYWSAHLCLGGVREKLAALVHKFFTKSLLLWMEILNLTKRIRFGTSMIRDAEKWCQKTVVHDGLTNIVRDAAQFVSVYANHPISQSTPHIYVSMLAFWPRLRPVSIAYMSMTAGILEPAGTAMARRQSALLATWRISNGRVYSISLCSYVGRIVAATQGAVGLFNTSTGDGVLHIQRWETQEVQVVAISPDGSQLVFGGKGGVYLVDVSSEAIRGVSGPGSPVWSIAYSPDGSHFACGLLNGDIYLYTSQQGEPVLGPLEAHTDVVSSIAFSPDGLFLASGSYDKSILVWEVKGGHLVGSPLKGHSYWVLSVSYSPDGTHIVSASEDATIRVWDPLTGHTVLGPLREHSDSVRSVAFSYDGAFIASASDDKTIRVYNARTGQTVLGPLEGHTGSVMSVIFSLDGTQLFSCSKDGTIRLWDVQNLDARNSQPDLPNDFCSIRYSHDGSRVASGSSDGNVCIWDVQTGGIVLGPLQGHSKTVWAVDLSSNNEYIASASMDSTLQIWSAHDGKGLHGPMKGHTNGVNCVRFSPDSSLLVSGSDDQTLRVWEVTSGESVIEPLKGHSGAVLSTAFSPNKALVVSGSSDFTIRVWDIKIGQTVVGPLQGHEWQVSSVEFSVDGSKIVSGSWDGSIRTWDAQTGQALLVWGKSQAAIYSVSSSSNGRYVVSASDDSTKRLWDAQTRGLILTLEDRLDNVRSVQFSPDGSYVVSCSDSGTIRFWDVSGRISNLQLNESSEPGEAVVATDLASGPWSLDSSGWLVGQQQQRLVWVPDDLCASTPLHPNDLVTGKQGSLKLSFDGVHIGEGWTGCYRP
ncbi:vegetative incompatibility protein HET-E-1 [Rhizoctonia solani AG-3 Rhs1AP]|uniref:Vegetative incompatibility protein HET-E-1 n=2 Tax=Rhizoctonia solani AG-3 TaxID=1086053 RepID=A0A074RMR9_9AGAM|nr:vegetative incompatibility protein HET-E-1 [Rhizoctonia solani AG-3 Rhs1AP]KEP46645.1 vegetative incompatibility protein HET-E-1 [Rhizoctonia solani 123E]